MSLAEIEAFDSVALLRMQNGVINAIGPDLLADLSRCIHEIRKHFGGVVLAGGEKFFSIGLDLPQLVTFNREQMGDFWEAFNQVVLQLYTLPQPTACALCGHATAGGAILALTGDFRYAARGRTLFGFNEVHIGVPVPYLADLILRQIVGDRIATRMLYFGEFMEAEAAQQAGIMDEVEERSAVESCAVERIQQLAAMPQPAFGMIKQNRIEAVHSAFLNNYEAKKEAFLICWFQEEVQNLLRKAAEKF